jgi:hypothetical protein
MKEGHQGYRALSASTAHPRVFTFLHNRNGVDISQSMCTPLPPVTGEKFDLERSGLTMPRV